MLPVKQLLELTKLDGVSIVKIVGKKIPDETISQNIGTQLLALVGDDNHTKIIIDFSNLEYISSTMLAQLVTMAQKARTAKVKLRLCGMQPAIHEVFGMARLGKLLDIKGTREEALADF